ncbi:MAG: ABC transporter ATP-binding protein [Candidatus Dormiibacterota bacterium]
MSITPGDAEARAGHTVEIRGAVKRYGKASVLSGVDLDIPAGRFLVLLGPSGSGKTTLARCLAGVERLDGGSIRFSGRLVSDGHHHLPPERRNLAMVFQDYALWPHLTAIGNVGYALRRRRLPGDVARRRAEDALEEVGLASLADRYPHELSGGQQQRVALARAVVARPGLLLFDEPLSNLDADLRERLRVQIATIARDSEATVVYITHDQAEAFALADDIAVLNKGELVQIGPPERIYRQPATLFVARFTGSAGELLGQVLGLEGLYATVDVAGHPLRVRYEGSVVIGSHVRVLVRPAATRVLPDSEISAAALPGTVADVAYRGRGYEHVLACAGGTLAAIFDSKRWPRGSELRIGLDPDGCVAYPDGFNSDMAPTTSPNGVDFVHAGPVHA